MENKIYFLKKIQYSGGWVKWTKGVKRMLIAVLKSIFQFRDFAFIDKWFLKRNNSKWNGKKTQISQRNSNLDSILHSHIRNRNFVSLGHSNIFYIYNPQKAPKMKSSPTWIKNFFLGVIVPKKCALTQNKSITRNIASNEQPEHDIIISLPKAKRHIIKIYMLLLWS